MARRTTVPGNAEPAQAPSRRTRRGKASAAGVPQAHDGQAVSLRQPTDEEIRRRAYELYLARGGRGGSPESDWLQAERELRGRG